MTRKTNDSRTSAKALGLLGSAIFVLTVLAAGNQAFAAASLNLVQVALQPAQNLPYEYSVVAYNATGYQVASYQSKYPGAAFQLPPGTYLVTASAYYQNGTYCYLCMQGAGVGTASTGAAMPIYKQPGGPDSEYGYAFTQVTGQSSMVINLQNAIAIPLTLLTVHVAYANGTAAAGAYVSGYVVGSYYSYSPQMVSYGQTGKSGSVTLTMPQAPVDVSAYISMPIKLPKNSSVVTVEIGGEKVNVTVSIQPSYLELFGQYLVVPPQTSAQIVLHYRPFGVPIVYAAAGFTGPTGFTSPTTTMATGKVGTSGQTPAATRIAPFNTTGLQAPQVSTSANTAVVHPATSLEGVAIGGVLLAAVLLAALWIRKSARGAPAL